MKCPHCSELIADEPKAQEVMLDGVLPSVIAIVIYCDNCEKVLGIIPDTKSYDRSIVMPRPTRRER